MLRSNPPICYNYLVNTKLLYLLDLTHPELMGLVNSFGEPAYRADQLLKWIYKKLACSYDDMTDLPQPLREKLASTVALLTLQPVDERSSADGQTRKTLFRLDDGKTIESTFMLYGETGSSRERRTVCVSSQVGCVMGCPFCATGQQGFERNLRPGEIIEQVLYFVRTNAKSQGAPEPLRRPITNVVFMGMGEPLANYENVWRAVTMLNSEKGLCLGARQLTISTAGLIPQITRLAAEKLHVELAISLHSAKDDVRNRLVPVNKKYPLSRLIPACRDYFQKTGRRITFEYALFREINDSAEDARKLASMLARLNCHVNLIAGNPTAFTGFKPSSAKQVRAFQKQLTAGNISNTIRQSKGVDIEAGCGQLRSRWLAKELSSCPPASQGSG